PPVYQEMLAASSGDTWRTATLTKLFEWEKAKTPKEKRDKLTTDEAAVAKDVEGRISSSLTHWQSLTLLMQQVGAFLGMYSFGWMAQRVGRRPTFLLAYLAAMVTTAYVFGNLKEPMQIFWMVPIMG